MRFRRCLPGPLLALLVALGCAGSEGGEVTTSATNGTSTGTGSNGTTGENWNGVFSPGGADPGGMALNAAGETIFFASHVRNRLSRIDVATAAVTASLNLPGGPIRAATSPTRGIFVALLDAGEVARFDENLQGLQSIKVGREPRSLAIDEARRRLYIALYGSDQIAAYDLDSLVLEWRVAVPRGPRFIVLNPGNGELLVGSALTGELCIVDPSGVLGARRRVGLAPTSGLYDSEHDCYHVTEYASGTLLRIRPSDLTELSRKDAGYGAVGIGIDRRDDEIFVGNSFGDIFAQLPLSSDAAGQQLPAPHSIQGFVFPPGQTHGFAADYRTGDLYKFTPGTQTFSGPL